MRGVAPVQGPKARPLGGFVADERGFVLVFFAVALPALLGLVGLVVDVSRVLILDTQLAGIADAAALAAASQLDRSPEAISKARDAGNGLGNTASFAAESSGLELTYRFAANLADLRASPTYTLADASGPLAAYVEVTTASRSVSATFLQVLGASAARTRRSATALSLYYACDVTPALLCHQDPERFRATAVRGRQYMIGLGGPKVDGAVALIDPPANDGERGALRSLASNAPSFCYGGPITLRDNLREEQLGEAINVRFDRYYNAGGRIEPDLAAFPPAPNILAGRRLESCRSVPSGGDVNPPFHLPRDSAFRTATRATPYDSGQGDWTSTRAYGGSGAPAAATALDEYLYWNHASKSQLFQSELATSRSRYELYLRELGLTLESEANPVVTRNSQSLSTMPTGGPLNGLYRTTTENPVPRCYEGPLPANDARRRIVYLGIADCGLAAAEFNPAELSLSIGKFFLTEPAGDGVVFAEFQTLLRPRENDGKLRHIVQLVDTR